MELKLQLPGFRFLEASLQSESQTPIRGPTNATRKQAKGGKRKEGGKAERGSKGEVKGEHRRKRGKKERTRERVEPAAAKPCMDGLCPYNQGWLPPPGKESQRAGLLP